MKKLLHLILVVFIGAGCQPDLTDDAIPWQPFDIIQINLNLPEFIKLKSDGMSMTIDGGVRGIILYRVNASTYHAYEANCSFEPNSACATVEVHSSTLYMFCSCCSSNFDLATGFPTAGPAWRPLRKYETMVNGSTLTITDQIVE